MAGTHVWGQGKFIVDIELANLSRPATIVMTVRQDGDWREYSSESHGKKFQLTGSLSEPSFAYLVMKYKDELELAPHMGNVTQIYIDNTKITVEAKDSLASAKINGPREQKDLETLNAMLTSMPNKADQNTRQEVIARFVAQHLDSYVSLYALQNVSLANAFVVEASRIEPMYNSLSARIRNSAQGRDLGNDIQIAKNTAIGSEAPDFSQMDTTNHPVKLSSLRGKYVLVDFWASWCKPCRIENPKLVRTYLAFRNKNFTVIGVSLDNNRRAWVKAINKDQLTWTHVSDLRFWRNEAALRYGVKTVPQNYLLDPNGRIVARNIPIEKLADELAKILP